LPGHDDAEVQSTAEAQTNGIVGPAFFSGDDGTRLDGAARLHAVVFRAFSRADATQ
jgi:hypothetical protein